MLRINAKGMQHDFEFLFSSQRDRLINRTYLKDGISKLEARDFRTLDHMSRVYHSCRMYR